jgi:tetratricopeptide (TPR) repeat protein
MLGKNAKSLEYVQKAYGILEYTKMQYSPNGISCLIQYARLLFDQRDFSEALRIYNNCLGLTKNIYGDDSLMAGYMMQNIAALYHIIHNTKNASLMYSQAESILSKHLGSEHEDVLQCHEQSLNLYIADKTSLMKVPSCGCFRIP